MGTERINLNELSIPSAFGEPGRLKDYGATSADATTQVFFRDLLDRLMEQIDAAEMVVGCVAWLSHFDVLEALAKKDGVSIIVQKEDFLRPDSAAVSDPHAWRKRLRHAYEAIPVGLSRGKLGGLLGEMLGREYRSRAEELSREWVIEDHMDPIRCVGQAELNGSAQPRMHNKFLIFCDLQHGRICPYAVWTGSFNISVNATRSLENAVLLKDEAIVRAYMREFIQIASVSEPLNWDAPAPTPEWWRGTGATFANFDPLGGDHDFGDE
jgi:hypothetical protein